MVVWKTNLPVNSEVGVGLGLDRVGLGFGLAVSAAVTVGLGDGVALVAEVAVGVGGAAVDVCEGVTDAVAVGAGLSVGLATAASSLEAVAVNLSGRSLGKGIAVMVGSTAPGSIPGMPQPTRVERTKVTRMLTHSSIPCFILRFPLKNYCLATKGM
jgi:hypothetical protein